MQLCDKIICDKLYIIEQKGDYKVVAGGLNLTKQRLDKALVSRGLVSTRSQAESYIKLGQVLVNGQPATKPGFLVDERADIKLASTEQYVSRAALKLASVMKSLELDFSGKTVLDVGSSTGGFTDYVLKHGTKKVIAVDVGTDQLHASLQNNPKIELHEQTDIRALKSLSSKPDIVLVDVSFISLRAVLPHIAGLVNSQTEIVVMVKPQFEAETDKFKHKGVVKNETMRRAILKKFETWAKQEFIVVGKMDSAVAGAKGNQERFYKLRKVLR